MASDLAALCRDVELLCLDAGNTIMFLDHERVARACAGFGLDTNAGALRRAEGEAKRAVERGDARPIAWSQAHLPSAATWGTFVASVLGFAGLAADRRASAVEALWRAHRAHNFWSRVPDGLVAALERLRAARVPIAVVSNSEGELEPFLDSLGLLRLVDLVLDSGVVGVEKPDPRIFRLALDRFRVPPERALHLGDTHTDVLGARAAAMRVGLIDPFGHLEGCHVDVPRVAGVPEVAASLVQERGG